MNVIEIRSDENVCPLETEVTNSSGFHSTASRSPNGEEQEINITKIGGGCESEENLGGPVFEPRLYMQRYSFVQQQLTKHGVTSVVDFGCAECKIARCLTNVPSVERIMLVDIDRSSLELNQHLIRPLTADYLYRRQSPLHVAVYAGSVTQYDKAISGVEAVTMVEVIEHLYPDVLSAAREMIFSQLRPRVVIMTTPNSEFNQLFPGHAGFRHWDHKFEWTRYEFQTWCEDITKTYPGYTCEFTGVGNPTPGSEHLGFCSQAVIFVRNTVGEQGELTVVGTKDVSDVDGMRSGGTANRHVTNSGDMQTGNDSVSIDSVLETELGNRSVRKDEDSEVDCRMYSGDQMMKALPERTSGPTKNRSVAIIDAQNKYIPDLVKLSFANLISQEMSSKNALTFSQKCSDLNGAVSFNVSEVGGDCSCPVDVTGGDRIPEHAKVPGQCHSEQLSCANPTITHADGDGTSYTHTYELIAECSYPYQDTPIPSLTESLLLEVRYTLPQYRHGAEYQHVDGDLYYLVPLDYIMARRKIKANFNLQQLRGFLQENDFKLSSDGDHVLMLEECDDRDLQDEEEDGEGGGQSDDTLNQHATDSYCTTDAMVTEVEECWD